jgi:hypothetical protein
MLRTTTIFNNFTQVQAYGDSDSTVDPQLVQVLKSCLEVAVSDEYRFDLPVLLEASKIGRFSQLVAGLFEPKNVILLLGSSPYFGGEVYRFPRRVSPPFSELIRELAAIDKLMDQPSYPKETAILKKSYGRVLAGRADLFRRQDYLWQLLAMGAMSRELLYQLSDDRKVYVRVVRHLMENAWCWVQEGGKEGSTHLVTNVYLLSFPKRNFSGL